MTSVKVAINLPVRVLERSIEFFTSLGFALNQHLSNDNGACIVLSDDINVMLVSAAFFKTISGKNIDTRRHRDVIVQLMVESRARVDDLVDKALAAGGRPVNEPNDMGYLYGRSFQDLDGHMWDIFHARG